MLGIHIAGKIGPRESQDDGMLLGLRTEFGAIAAYLFRIGDFSLGPYGEATAIRNTLNSVLGVGEWDEANWWSFRGALGMEMTLKLSEQLSIFADWTFGGNTNRKTFERVSTKTKVLRTPLMDYMFTIGLATSVL